MIFLKHFKEDLITSKVFITYNTNFQETLNSIFQAFPFSAFLLFSWIYY